MKKNPLYLLNESHQTPACLYASLGSWIYLLGTYKGKWELLIVPEFSNLTLTEAYCHVIVIDTPLSGQVTEFLLLCSTLYNSTQGSNSGLAMYISYVTSSKSQLFWISNLLSICVVKLKLPPVFTSEIKLMQVKNM